MEIGGARGAKQLTPRHWRKLAADNALDPDIVERIACNTVWLVLENMDRAYEDLPARMADVLRRQLAEANRGMQPEPPENRQPAMGQLYGMPPLDEPPDAFSTQAHHR